MHNGCADWGSDASCASDSEDEHEHDEGGGANRQMFDSASSSESGSPSGSPGDAFPDGVTHTSLVAALPPGGAAGAAAVRGLVEHRQECLLAVWWMPGHRPTPRSERVLPRWAHVWQTRVRV